MLHTTIQIRKRLSTVHALKISLPLWIKKKRIKATEVHPRIFHELIKLRLQQTISKKSFLNSLKCKRDSVPNQQNGGNR